MFEALRFEAYMDSCSKFYRELDKMKACTAVHFCSMQTLDAVLESGFLRAVDSRFMNDLGEYCFGIDVLKKHMRCEGRIKKVIPMTVSFSTERDLTPQWFLYAKESGVGIEFDFNYQAYWRNNHLPNHIYVEGCEPTVAQATKGGVINTQIPYPLNLVYLEGAEVESDELKQLVKALKSICKRKRAEDIPAKLEEVLPLAATFIKSNDFAYEKEARISTFAFESAYPEGQQSEIHYHANGVYLRPYVNLCFVRNDTEPQNIGWPIKTIWVGPGRNQKKAVESVIKRLEFGKVKTFPIPYDVFIERLCSYLEDLLVSVAAALGHHENDKNAVADDAKSLTQDLFDEGVRHQRKKGKIFHACVDEDGYIRAREALRCVRSRVVDKLCEITKKTQEETEWQVEKYEEENYFSWYGIWVRASSRKLSFV